MEQPVGGSPLNFFFAPSIEVLGALVPENNLVLQIANEDGIMGQIQKRRNRFFTVQKLLCQSMTDTLTLNVPARRNDDQ